MLAPRWLIGLVLLGGLSLTLATAVPAPRATTTVPAAAARPVDFAIADGEEVTIGTWNLKFFYDNDTTDNKTKLAKDQSAPDEAKYKERVKLTAAAIATMKPTLLGLEEIENQKVVEDLAAALKTNHGLDYTVGFIQGKDFSTEQDVAFLAQKRPGDLTFSRVEDAGLGDLSNANLYKIPSKHLALQVTHTRPDGQPQKLTVIVAHFKAGGGNVNEAQRVRQGRVLNKWATQLMSTGGGVIVVGDFNAGKRWEDTSAADGIGILRGLETATLADDLFDLNSELLPADRRTHVTGRELDRIIVSPNLLDETGLVFKSIANYRHLVVRGMSADDDANKTFYDYAIDEADLSDHYPLIAKFKYMP